ncbi:ABC transporter permease [Acidisphaera sp. S103]|uniref:ABC transporter permease n=1 Tax=Acidisphaera sp. S103 TaxID=1747223 RepID=UPI001C205289|nr:ABC transporter permease [Acidisphaera sp. S103]
MIQFVLRKLSSTAIVMGLVAVIVFLLIHLSPGDPAAIIAGDQATPAMIEQIRAGLGLDQPLIVQFWLWLVRLAHGDLGVSLFSHVPVGTLIMSRIQPTVSLAVATMLFAILTAIPLGVVAAWQVGRWVDRAVMALAIAAFSFPIFLIGYALVWGFALKLRILPVQGYTTLGNGIVPYLQHLVLPALSLGLVFMALLTRMTRSTMIEVLGEDYIRTARAKGLGQGAVLIKHGLKNAAVPLVTTIGNGIALLIGGVVVTESVFSIPGIGRLTIDAVTQRDFPVIQGIILVTSFTYVVVNLLVDLSYRLFDPRVRA